MDDPFARGAVPVPNAVFDEWLPRLSDAELRVLLVIVRATLGWREGSERGGWRYKRRDWLTNSQLVKRTGRSSSSISRAVQALVLHGLICAESTGGDPLDTPELRRRNIGRIYYRLGDMWTTAPQRVDGGKWTTTNNKDNNLRTRGIVRAQPGQILARPASGLARVSELLSHRKRER